MGLALNETLWLGAGFVFALLVSTLLVPVLARPAQRIGLIDRPGGRKRHACPVPLTGGIAIAVAVGSAAWLPLEALHVYRPFVGWFAAAAVALLACGALDDAFEMHWKHKAACQLCAAIILVVGGNVRVMTLGALFGGSAVELGGFAVPFTLLVLLGYVNALNMMDGVDGLAGGIALITFASIGVAAALAGETAVLVLTVVFAGAVLGFLPWNLLRRAHAAAFLGDSGAHLLALAVGATAIALARQSPQRLLVPMSVAWILALPVMDALVVMGRRFARGQSPVSADRCHIHHVLQDLGLSPRLTTLALLALAFAYGLFGIFGRDYFHLASWQLAIAFVLAFLVHAVFVITAENGLRRRRAVRGSLTKVEDMTP